MLTRSVMRNSSAPNYTTQDLYPVRCFKNMDKINGACGAAHGTVQSTAPSTTRCNAGEPSAVSTSSADKYTWSCVGENAGTTANCTACKSGFTWNGSACISNKVNGVCGSNHQKSLTTKPTSNLCNPGTASAVGGNGPWTRTCAGSNGGTTASCSASLACSSSYNLTSCPVGTNCTSCGGKYMANGCQSNWIQQDGVCFFIAQCGPLLGGWISNQQQMTWWADFPTAKSQACAPGSVLIGDFARYETEAGVQRRAWECYPPAELKGVYAAQYKRVSYYTECRAYYTQSDFNSKRQRDWVMGYKNNWIYGGPSNPLTFHGRGIYGY